MGVINTNLIGYKLVANGTILDIFKDEDIIISDNITGLFDIGTLPADFSRTILVPGTKKNNAFFEHVYDISVDTPFLFATNVKVPAYLDFDGIYLVSGYLQLNKVNILEDIGIESYEVSLYGTVSSFARDINRFYLTNLTSLTKYNHTSSLANISSSWHGNLFDGDIVYPLADYGKGLRYTTDNDNNGIDDVSGSLHIQDFKPAIRVKAVWDSIFETFGYTYSSSFWSEPWVDDMYMVCNYGLKYPEYTGIDLENYGVVRISAISGSGTTNVILPDTGSVTRLPWDNVEKDPQVFIGNNTSYNLPISSSLRGTITLNLQISGSKIGAPDIALRYWETGSSSSTAGSTELTAINDYFTQWYEQANAANDQAVKENFQVSTEFTTQTLNPGTYYFGLSWSNQYPIPNNVIKLILDPTGKPKSNLSINEVCNVADGRIMDIPSNMPYGTQGIRIIDFIKGLQKKFNLIIYPNKTKPNELIVESFNDWYNRGTIKDFNKYINLSKPYDVIPANNYAVNKVTFTDLQDTDYVSTQFQRASNRIYGASYYNDTQNFFSQGELKVETTFGNGPLVYLQGTGVSGSVGGYNPPQPVYYTYYVGNQGWSTSNLACSNTYYYPTTLYTNASDINSLTKLYTDTNLTNPFNGNYYYWKLIGSGTGGNYYSAFIDYAGNVSAVDSCFI